MIIRNMLGIHFTKLRCYASGEERECLVEEEEKNEQEKDEKGEEMEGGEGGGEV